MAACDFNTMPYEQPSDNCVAFMRISTADLARAQKFYSEVFDWTFQDPAYLPTIRVFKTGGQVMGALHQRDDAGSKPSPIVNYIKVADVDETLKKAVAAGGKVVKEKFNEGGHSDLAEFEDTEGNTLGLLHWHM
jgi:uncharacterized protein